MTVNQLIEELKDFKGNAKVQFALSRGGAPMVVLSLYPSANTNVVWIDIGPPND